MKIKQFVRSVAGIVAALAMILSLNVSGAAADNCNANCYSDANQAILENGCIVVEGSSRKGVTLENRGLADVVLEIGAAGFIKSCDDGCNIYGPKGEKKQYNPNDKYPDLIQYALILDCQGSDPTEMGLSADNVTVKQGETCTLVYNDGYYIDNSGEFIVSYYPQ